MTIANEIHSFTVLQMAMNFTSFLQMNRRSTKLKLVVQITAMVMFPLWIELRRRDGLHSWSQLQVDSIATH